jgi:hypothetical protein
LFAILFARHEPFDMDAYRAAHTEFVLKALGFGAPKPSAEGCVRGVRRRRKEPRARAREGGR